MLLKILAKNNWKDYWQIFNNLRHHLMAYNKHLKILQISKNKMIKILIIIKNLEIKCMLDNLFFFLKKKI